MAHERRFSIARFSIFVTLQFAALLVAFRLLLPKLWESNVAAGVWAFILTFFAVHLFLAFFEWFFHRYILHGITMWWLQRFAHGHRHHHSLTPIRLRPVTEGSDRFVLNEYPITREEQYPDSAFPVYALAGFWLFFSPLLVVAQLLLPRLPILLAGYSAITWSMVLYEILHAIDHWPYEWWKKATEHPRFGAFWRLLYGFHLMHHANIGCNEAIGGFFSLPVPDWCLGTFHHPKELLLEGRMATAKDFSVRTPPALVRWMDRWARRRESRIVRRDSDRDVPKAG
jgi:hemolysin III